MRDRKNGGDVARQIQITVGELELTGSLNDSPTANGIWELLPLERSVGVWGDEFYFDIGLNAELEPGASDEVEVGDLAYWPPGRALCIFFGPTPASQGAEPRVASAANLVGSLDEVPVDDLRSVPSGSRIRIEPVV
jgi:hypothetical protein